MSLDKNELLTEISDNFPDNSEGEISASDLRVTTSQMVTSAANLHETSTQTFAGPVAFTGGIEGILDGRIIVSSSSDFEGTLDSTKEYFLDGIIDMGNTSIEVPAGGLSIAGYDFNRSGLTSSASNYTLFTSPGGGSGDMLFKNFFIEVTGTNSKVHDNTASLGSEAYEIDRINFNNCTSRGEINGYRQGLEGGTGYFGGKPELVLSGAWSGGYFIETSVARGMTADTYSLFSAGASFVMQSRFRTNQNADLPTGVSLIDFAPANFPNPSTVQITGAIVSRAGVFDPNDANISPNLDYSDLSALFTGNVGVRNTHVGGKSVITSEAVTTITDSVSWFDVAGTFTASDLQHFTAPSNGQLRNDGQSPVDFKVQADLVVEGNSGDDISIRIAKWDNSASSIVTVSEQERVINAFTGARDLAFFSIIGGALIDKDDYVFLQVRNNSSTNNVTVENDSFFVVEER